MTSPEHKPFEVKALEALVCHHFSLALRECQRSSSFMTRYVWRLPGGKLHLLMPRSIPGRKRPLWLKVNVSDADPTRPNERQRVQAIIDAEIGQRWLFSLNQDANLATDWPPLTPTPMPGAEAGSVSVGGLAACIAREMAATIAQQRPAIQALGPEKLKEMIHTILKSLAEDCYCLAEVAKQYGISKPTLSRFAGIRWHSATRLDCTVPDLWRKTAQVIGRDPEFVEAAKRAGVWQMIASVTRVHCASESPPKGTS